MCHNIETKPLRLYALLLKATYVTQTPFLKNLMRRKPQKNNEGGALPPVWVARRRRGGECEGRGRNLSLTAQLVILVVPDHIELQIRHRAVAYEDRPAESIHEHGSRSMSATCQTLLGTAGCGMLQTVPS